MKYKLIAVIFILFSLVSCRQGATRTDYKLHSKIYSDCVEALNGIEIGDKYEKAKLIDKICNEYSIYGSFVIIKDENKKQ